MFLFSLNMKTIREYENDLGNVQISYDALRGEGVWQNRHITFIVAEKG